MFCSNGSPMAAVALSATAAPDACGTGASDAMPGDLRSLAGAHGSMVGSTSARGDHNLSLWTPAAARETDSVPRVPLAKPRRFHRRVCVTALPSPSTNTPPRDRPRPASRRVRHTRFRRYTSFAGARSYKARFRLVSVRLWWGTRTRLAHKRASHMRGQVTRSASERMANIALRDGE